MNEIIVRSTSKASVIRNSNRSSNSNSESPSHRNRNRRVVLQKVHPDSDSDSITHSGSQFNGNGIVGINSSKSCMSTRLPWRTSQKDGTI